MVWLHIMLEVLLAGGSLMIFQSCTIMCIFFFCAMGINFQIQFQQEVEHPTIGDLKPSPPLRHNICDQFCRSHQRLLKQFGEF